MSDMTTAVNADAVETAGNQLSDNSKKRISKDNIINLLKGILIICLAVAILLSCSNILTLKSEDGISQFKSFYKQKENSVDLLFMGSSHTYCNISTGILWENYGISSFNLGGAEAPLWSTYYQMKEALKYQRPKVMALEVSTAAIRPTLDPPEFWIEDNAYGMKWNMNRINLMKVQTDDWLFKRIVFPLSTMHQRYNALTKDDFVDVNSTINYKGYDYRDTVVPYETPDVSGVTEIGEISDRANEYLYKIIDLCREENIELWFFITPYATNAEHQAIYNYFEKVASEENIPYVNFNDPEYIEAMGFDYSTDLADELHVNLEGSEKFSNYLGKYLNDIYDLPDHRGDAYYSSWDVDAVTLRMQRANHKLTVDASDSDFINALNEEGYVVFVSLGQGASKLTIPADTFKALIGLGISMDDLDMGRSFIVSNGNVLYSSQETVQEAVLNGKEDKLLFKRTNSDEEGREYKTTLNIGGREYEFVDSGVEVYAYDNVNSLMAGYRQIVCGQ